MKKLVLGAAALALLAGGVFGARTVDRMAVGYLTARTRGMGRGLVGNDLPSGGPVPGYAFLGFTRPSEDPPGMRIMRPWEMAAEIGLARGDVVTSVEGESFRSADALMRFLVGNYRAGDVISLVAEREGERPRELSMKLRAFVRDPGDLDLPFEDVELRSTSGFALRGWLIPPPERSDGRVGVFVHGASASRYQALESAAKHWYRRGYGLLAMDLSGEGASEGDYITYTVNERLDVASMLEWARHHEKIDPRRIVLFGTSNGASSAIYAAAGDRELPALVVDAPYSDLWDAAGHMLRSRGGHPLFRYPLSIAIRIRAGFDIADVRPLDVITQVSAPMLFVHGDADRQVPLTHSEQLHQARERAGLVSELWVLPGGEHGFDNYPPEGIFWNRILDFFDRALGGAPTEWNFTSGS